MSLSFRSAALGLLVLAATGGVAGAQTYQSLPSTPLLIGAVEATTGEHLAPAGAPMLRQPIASLRAARLEAAAATPLGPGFASELAAGTILSGVQAPDGWAYCAVAQGVNWFFQPTLACFQDTDGDGRFDVIRPSGRPFRDVPILVFQLGPPTRLPTPVAWSELPDTAPAAIDYVLSWRPDRGGGVILEASLRVAGRTTVIDSLPPARTIGEVTMRGARIELLGRDPGGALRYRVLQATPARIERITMTVTTAPAYVYVAP